MGYGRIISVEAGSLAEELEIIPGDKILEVNGTKLRDIIDLSFAFADEEIELFAKVQFLLLEQVLLICIFLKKLKNMLEKLHH